MIVVEQVIEECDLDGLDTDTLRLTWEGRQKSRQRVRTSGGRELGLALSTGTTLNPGDVLYFDDEVAIVVEGVSEDVFVIQPETRESACLVCHQLGNLHRAIALDGSDVLVLYEPSLDAALQRLGCPYSKELRVFSPSTHAAGHHVH